MKIIKGDKVRIISGKDKDREGKVVKVYRNQKRVIVEGVNIYKKHVKKNEQMPQGGVVDVPRAIHVSNVMLICPKTKKPTRVGYKISGKKKVRVAKISGVTI